ncbi:hypothetical protein KY329_03085 [Candidatus Woesearchaeota archaeon]|nr:hypothetical protein [Candidatus Woesearchaeota archaeon]
MDAVQGLVMPETPQLIIIFVLIIIVIFAFVYLRKAVEKHKKGIEEYRAARKEEEQEEAKGTRLPSEAKMEELFEEVQQEVEARKRQVQAIKELHNIAPEQFKATLAGILNKLQQDENRYQGVVDGLMQISSRLKENPDAEVQEELTRRYYETHKSYEEQKRKLHANEARAMLNQMLQTAESSFKTKVEESLSLF